MTGEIFYPSYFNFFKPGVRWIFSKNVLHNDSGELDFTSILHFQLSYMHYRHLVLLTLIFISIAISSQAQSLENRFLSPPDSVRTGIFWYWMSNNISKQGAIKDLQAMKKAGITLAFIGNIGPSTHHNQNYPYGKVKFMSPEWWDIFHTALKTASELGIEIGIFNSAGWSQSGGPWVKPEQSMRYLASTEVQVTGPATVSQKLPMPAKDFQDVNVLAFPSIRQNLFRNAGSQTIVSDNLTKLADAGYKLPATESSITLQLPERQFARSLLIYPGDFLNVHCSLQVREGNGYRTIKEFDADRDASLLLSNGFNQRAPVVESFPDAAGQEFRLVFSNVKANSTVTSIVLTPAPVIQRYPGKTFAKIEEGGTNSSNTTDSTLFINPKQVLDLSKHLSADGTLNWTAPKGDWTIMRTGMVSTGIVNSPASPEATGLETDKLSKEHITAHFNAFIGEIYKRIPVADRRCWKYTVLDSYEKGGQNMTDGMLEKFKKHYGYDPAPYLPALYGYPIGSLELSDRFLWDMRRFIADQIAYQYVAGLTELSHQYGLKSWLENYGHGGFSAEFLQYGGQADEIAGEFWTNKHTAEKRAAASCAHIYGKKIVWAESFTNEGRNGSAFQRYPGMLKPYADLAFSEGINSMLLHVFIQQYDNNEYPGVDGWFGTEFNRKNTYFSQIDPFVRYIQRTSFLLQQGRNVADVAYYIGESTPIMTGSMKPDLPKGYNFDFINSEVLIRDLAVQNGRLVLPNGTSYGILVLPPQNAMRPAVLRKLEQLVTQGAVIIGLPPTHSPSLQNYPSADLEVQQLTAKLWGKIDTKQLKTVSRVLPYGKGKILMNFSLTQAFDLLQIRPDCLPDNDSVVYTHRRDGQNDIYFLANQSQKSIQFSSTFRVPGKQPELWNPVTGTSRPLPAYMMNDKGTTVPLQLAPYESAFIIFKNAGKPSSNALSANFPKPTVLASVTGPWKVQFDSDSIKRGPLGVVTFNQLTDWTTSNDPRIKNYSGTAIYHNTIVVNKLSQRPIYLDLGKVNVMATVKINGQNAGGVWTAPYRLNVTPLLKDGINDIEVEVVNTWINRILGDQTLPEQARRLRPHTVPWKPDTPLQASGLIGPVQLVSIPEK